MEVVIKPSCKESIEVGDIVTLCVCGQRYYYLIRRNGLGLTNKYHAANLSGGTIFLDREFGDLDDLGKELRGTTGFRHYPAAKYQIVLSEK